MTISCSKYQITKNNKINYPPDTPIYYEEWLHVSTLKGLHQNFIMKHYIQKAAYILGIPISVYKYKIRSGPKTTYIVLRNSFVESQ